MLTREAKDNNIRDAPATEIELMWIFLYDPKNIVNNAKRHTSPQTRRNIGEAYPMLREKRFRDSIIKIIEAHLLITIIACIDDPIMK